MRKCQFAVPGRHLACMHTGVFDYYAYLCGTNRRANGATGHCGYCFSERVLMFY